MTTGEPPREDQAYVGERTAAEPTERETEREYRGTGVYVSVVLGFLLAAILIVFIAQNTEGVTLEWTVWEADVSLAVVVLGSLAAGALLAELVGAVWRHRRRRSLTRRRRVREQ